MIPSVHPAEKCLRLVEPTANCLIRSLGVKTLALITFCILLEYYTRHYLDHFTVETDVVKGMLSRTLG